jgi:hypothetical protein
LINLPENASGVWLVYLFGERLYTEADETLYVYSLSDITSPCATYQSACECYSGLITENRLYLGGIHWLQIFEVTPSLSEPLMPVTKIPIKGYAVNKILRVGDELLLG